MTSPDTTPGIGAPKQAPSPSELQQLRDELTVFSEESRLDAARKLGTLHDKRAVPDLIGRLHIDGSPVVRKAAIEALYAINDPSAWPDIAALLKNDDSSDVRRKAAEVLGLSGDQTQAVALVGALRDNSPGVRTEAAIGIGKLQNLSVIPSLIAGLAKADGKRAEEFEQAHIDALVQIGGLTVVVEVLNSANACKDPSGGYQPDVGSGSYKLQKIADRYSSYDLSAFYRNRIAVVERLEIVRASIDDAAPALVVATRSMAAFHDAKSVESLSHLAVHYAVPAVRWLALCSLQERKAADSEDSLQRVLAEDTDWIVRKKAAEILGDLRIQPANDLLCRKAVSDDHHEVRYQATIALGQIAVPAAIPTLGEIVQRSPDAKARILAVRALGQIKAAQAIGPLTSALGTDRIPDVRAEAARALGNTGSSATLSYLLQVMRNQSENVQVRVAAAGAALELDAVEAVDDLWAMIASVSSFDVRKTIVELLAGTETDKATACLVKVLTTMRTELTFGPQYSGFNNYNRSEQNLQHLGVDALASRRTSTAICCLCDIICARPRGYDAYITKTAMDSLTSMDHRAVFGYLKEAINDAVNPKYGVEVLTQLDIEEVGDELVATLGSLLTSNALRSDQMLLTSVAYALVAKAPNEAVSLLASALRTNNKNVGYAAIEGLTRLGSQEAGMVLQTYLMNKKNDDFLRERCIAAIAKLKFMPAYGDLQQLAGAYGQDSLKDAARTALTDLKNKGEKLPGRTSFFGPYWTPKRPKPVP